MVKGEKGKGVEVVLAYPVIGTGLFRLLLTAGAFVMIVLRGPFKPPGVPVYAIINLS